MLIAGTELVTLALTVRPNPQPGLHLVVALLWCGPIILLRRWPLPVLAVTTAGTGLVMARGNIPLVFGLMIGLAMYFAAAGLPRRVSIPAAVAAATGLGGALIYAARLEQGHAAGHRGDGRFRAVDGGLVHRRQRCRPPPVRGRTG